MKITQRRAVSPIIATLLLIAIAVASGVVVYVFTNGLASNLTKSHVGQVTEQLSLDAFNYAPIGGNTSLTLYLRNTGGSSVTINAVYFDGSTLTTDASSTTLTIAAQGTLAIQLTNTGRHSVSPVIFSGSGVPATPTAQTTHAVKVVTIDGGIFNFNVAAGLTG